MAHVRRQAMRAGIELRVRMQKPRNALRAGGGSPSVIVSLTSFPARIETVWLTLRTLLNQSRPPDRVILVLSQEEFPGSRLPASLTEPTGLGVEILWVAGNTRSYKKLVPVLATYPNEIIVTADDEVLYPRSWLAELLEVNERHPTSVVAHRANAIVVEDGRLAPYMRWTHADTLTPSRLVFPTGAGGVLYPPGSLPPVTLDTELAMKLCPQADDVWWKAMSLLAGTSVRTVSDSFNEFPNSLSSQRTSLVGHNASVVDASAGRIRNDDQLDAVLAHFDLLSRVR